MAFIGLRVSDAREAAKLRSRSTSRSCPLGREELLDSDFPEALELLPLFLDTFAVDLLLIRPSEPERAGVFGPLENDW